MPIAKLFKNGNSQAVRLPKEYRFEGDEVYINKVGNMIVLIPKKDPWSSLLNSIGSFSDDFMTERNQGTYEEREPL